MDISVIKKSVLRIIEELKSTKKERENEFLAGKSLGLYIALSMLQNDMAILGDIEDENVLDKIGLNIELEKLL